MFLYSDCYVLRILYVVATQKRLLGDTVGNSFLLEWTRILQLANFERAIWRCIFTIDFSCNNPCPLLFQAVIYNTPSICHISLLNFQTFICIIRFHSFSMWCISLLILRLHVSLCEVYRLIWVCYLMLLRSNRPSVSLDSLRVVIYPSILKIWYSH